MVDEEVTLYVNDDALTEDVKCLIWIINSS